MLQRAVKGAEGSTLTRFGRRSPTLWYGRQFIQKRRCAELLQEIGVDTLEMDTVFTKDGVPVVWHDVGTPTLALLRL